LSDWGSDGAAPQTEAGGEERTETSIVSILIASAVFALPRAGAPAGRDPGPPGLELIIGEDLEDLIRISRKFLTWLGHLHFGVRPVRAVFGGENAI
jgi:hypothetical protein